MQNRGTVKSNVTCGQIMSSVAKSIVDNDKSNVHTHASCAHHHHDDHPKHGFPGANGRTIAICALTWHPQWAAIPEMLTREIGLKSGITRP